MRRNPLGTKMATCAVGFAAGDIVAQVLAHQKTPNLPGLPQRTFLQAFDYGRAARMSLFGGLIAAPQMHVFFNWLDRVCIYRVQLRLQRCHRLAAAEPAVHGLNMHISPSTTPCMRSLGP